MVVKLYTIYDRVAEECGELYQAKNDAVAVRNYKNFLERTKAGTHDEFWLFYVGDLDTTTMEVAPRKPFRVVTGEVQREEE